MAAVQSHTTFTTELQRGHVRYIKKMGDFGGRETLEVERKGTEVKGNFKKKFVYFKKDGTYVCFRYGRHLGVQSLISTDPKVPSQINGHN